MEKEFLDVFRNLEVGEELRALLKEVAVTKIAVNPQKDRIRIYIRSRQWIYLYLGKSSFAAVFSGGEHGGKGAGEVYPFQSIYTAVIF